MESGLIGWVFYCLKQGKFGGIKVSSLGLGGKIPNWGLMGVEHRELKIGSAQKKKTSKNNNRLTVDFVTGGL